MKKRDDTSCYSMQSKFINKHVQPFWLNIVVGFILFFIFRARRISLFSINDDPNIASSKVSPYATAYSA